jgi:cyanophycinase
MTRLVVRSLVVLVGLAAAGGAACAAEPGRLVIVGGALSPDNEPVYREILAGVEAGRALCILPTASAEPRSSALSYRKDFDGYGGEGTSVVVPLTTANPEKASSESFAADLRRCGGFFFTGGDQSRIVDVLRPEGKDSLAARAIRRAHAKGAVVAGSSAGAAMMSDPMIGAGDPGAALRRGVTRVEGRKGVWVRDGMGFLEQGLTGQHFAARSRLPRLLVALRAHPDERFGLGVDEDTALVVDGDEARVVGRSVVLVAEVRDDDFLLHVLADGDRFDLSSGEPMPREGLVALAATDGELERAPRRPYDRDALQRHLVAFARSNASETTVGRRRERLVLRKAEGFRALVSSGADESEIRTSLFAGPFVVSRKPAESR